jgi:hypothetical protein
VGRTKLRQTWRKWSLINRIGAIAAIITIPLGIVQGGQLLLSGYNRTREAIYGPAPLTLPLRTIHKGMLEEIEYNLDCLESYWNLGDVPPQYPMCEPRKEYIESWFYHISAITSRDYYSDSTDLMHDWNLVKSYQAGLAKIRTRKQLEEFEKQTQLNLRDALFLTGYMRYFYKNFYEKKLDDDCQDSSFDGKFTPACKADYMRLYGDMKEWQEQVDGWDGMPAKYALDEGKPVGDYPAWLGLSD